MKTIRFDSLFSTRFSALLIFPFLSALMVGCMSSEKELQRVSKDWCMTIRASQVLPVYPPHEDVQPGDVFAVQVPLSQQTKIYHERGFLALDQLVTRLHDLDYDQFYADAYWMGTYAGTPKYRPGSGGTNQFVAAPQVAFPTYNFSVNKGNGMILAIPISGVPVGLGLMGASKATGSVSLTDAYTYGIDIETAASKLYEWWQTNEETRAMLSAAAAGADKEVYLRCVNRVFIVRGIGVDLTKIKSLSGGVDGGAAQEIKLPDLSGSDATQTKASADAYASALQALNSVVGELKENMPGGSFRFSQVGQSSVSLSQNFERPLVIGYLGFDAKVYPDGRLSPPIPSYAVLNDKVDREEFEALDFSTTRMDDDYAEWIAEDNNFQEVSDWLESTDWNLSPVDLYGSPKFRFLLVPLNEKFNFSTKN